MKVSLLRQKQAGDGVFLIVPLMGWYLNSRKVSFDVGNLPIDGRVESPASMASENKYNSCRQGGHNDQLMCSSLAKIDNKATSHY